MLEFDEVNDAGEERTTYNVIRILEGKSWDRLDTILGERRVGREKVKRSEWVSVLLVVEE
jgi:hypothetical protein